MYETFSNNENLSKISVGRSRPYNTLHQSVETLLLPPLEETVFFSGEALFEVFLRPLRFIFAAESESSDSESLSNGVEFFGLTASSSLASLLALPLTLALLEEEVCALSIDFLRDDLDSLAVVSLFLFSSESVEVSAVLLDSDFFFLEEDDLPLTAAALSLELELERFSADFLLVLESFEDLSVFLIFLFSFDLFDCVVLTELMLG
ncbi:hypothetical protein FF38_07065 [Lucilia cuprina]|uniref:Uncharacterized protein n=1 Tax=Lucilia cuprina TaxID=7375 RepID=A0A0L0CJR4_LUCCU|nr:hypothetical protein FF38_07065 [Lucilia cuprina]